VGVVGEGVFFVGRRDIFASEADERTIGAAIRAEVGARERRRVALLVEVELVELLEGQRGGRCGGEL
jgi:hypothetical protein